MGQKDVIQKLVFIALLVALSVVLGYIDRMLQFLSPIAGYKLGLANIVILTGLYYLNFKDSLLLIVLKSVITGLMLANVMTFMIGFSGTLLSFLAMYILLKIARNKISLIGVSVVGGIFHNIGQIVAVRYGYGQSIIVLLPYFIIMGIGTGVFVGIMVNTLTTYLNKGEVFKTITGGYRIDEFEEMNE